MRGWEDEINFIKHYFEDAEEGQIDSKAKEFGLRLIEMVLHLKKENHFLRERVIKANQDFEWIEKRADEWMIKAMENSESKKL
ncbi:hypothetical protein V7200_10580 [Cytobacillus firmus]|uniref:Uncharacterized protein n=1 Tax=Cytobacillus firmus TaxID=1399 RepID=A0A800MYU2_CYTFI|nr:hypothetical protein [Cytobacillus firmus]KAF0824989.1 hypothetical protein KIS1582_1191 [Cytobacillus firmus]